MTQRIDAESETCGELLLHHVELGPDRFHVDIRGNVYAVAAGVRRSACPWDQGAGQRVMGDMINQRPRPSSAMMRRVAARNSGVSTAVMGARLDMTRTNPMGDVTQ
jgi:hypothetical protein